MKKLLIISCLSFGLSAGFAFSESNIEEEKTAPPKIEEVKKKADCKKVCTERDGYGQCIKFEEKCK